MKETNIGHSVKEDIFVEQVKLTLKSTKDFLDHAQKMNKHAAENWLDSIEGGCVTRVERYPGPRP